MHYDARTAILFSTAVTLAVLAIALLSMRRGAGNSIPGLAAFVVANLLGMCATVLFALGRAIPLAASTNLGNVALLLSAGLYVHAICSFDGKPLPSSFFFTLSFLALVVTYLVYNPFEPAFTIVVSHAAMSIFTIYCGLQLLHGRARPGFNRTFCAAGFYAVAIVSSLRLLSILSDPSVAVLPDTPATLALFIGFSMAQAIFGLGFLMMVHERIARSLAHMATHDPLTGARTRGYFMDKARSTVQGARNRRRHVSILIADLDHFKLINDAHGHQAGDRALCGFVKAAQSALREGDFLARYGGEEFVALLPDTTFSEAVAIAERVRANAQAHSPQAGFSPLSITVTVSIGVATTEHGGFDLEALIAAADKALYASKANGRNRVTLATSPPHSFAPQSTSLH